MFPLVDRFLLETSLVSSIIAQDPLFIKFGLIHEGDFFFFQTEGRIHDKQQNCRKKYFISFEL